MRKVKTKQEDEKEKLVSVLNYNQNTIGADLKNQHLYTFLTERKNMTKWYIKMFRLLNATILNPMVICRANSQGIRIDHLKFRIDMVQTLFVQYGGVKRKVTGCHSMNNTVPRPFEKHSPAGIPPTERKSRATKRCAACYKNKRKKTSVLVS
jgi:hypothetical protein